MHSFPGVIYLGVEQQKTLGYKILEHLPYRSYTRKNIAYLWAIEHGARFIYDTDDDNHPTNGQLNFHLEPTTSGLIYDGQSQDVMNPYSHFGQPSIWPRGYPLQNINVPNRPEYVLCHFQTPVVQQGVVNGDPDVDAIFRLTRKDPKGSINVTFDASAPPVTLPPGVFAPYNSQNTFFTYQALWSLFLPSSVAFRVTDIWRGYWAQRLLWLLGHKVAFFPPNAVQVRNAHNYLEDFKDEDSVYTETQRLIAFLKAWTCKEQSFYACVRLLSHGMAAERFWAESDADLIDLWIEDLKSIHYPEPEMIPEHSLFQPATSLCFNATDSRTVFFNPVLRKQQNAGQPTQLFQNPLIPALSNLQTFCGPYLNQSIQQMHFAPSATNVSTESRPDDLLLIVAYNSPFYENINFLDNLYFDHFQNILYCGEVASYEVLQTSIRQGPFPWRTRDITFMNVSSQAGYFLYECAFRAIEMNYGVAGYLVLGDDVLLNLWNMKLLQKDEPQFEVSTHEFKRLNGSTIWQWWSTDYGQIPSRAAMDELQTIRQSGNNPASKAIRTFFDNRIAKGIDDNTVSKSMSDFYYVPWPRSRLFAQILRIFYKYQVFTEIAVPTALVGLSMTDSMNRTLGINLITPVRSQTWTYYNNNLDNLLYLHPIKLSNVIKNPESRKSYCSNYVSQLISTSQA